MGDWRYAAMHAGRLADKAYEDFCVCSNNSLMEG